MRDLKVCSVTEDTGTYWSSIGEQLILDKSVFTLSNLLSEAFSFLVIIYAIRGGACAPILSNGTGTGGFGGGSYY